MFPEVIDRNTLSLSLVCYCVQYGSIEKHAEENL